MRLTNTIEPLESRFLCSATLRGGTLQIIGTDGDDIIQFSHPLISATQVDLSHTRVDLIGASYIFKTKSIKRIFIDAGDGENRIEIGQPPRCNFCTPFGQLPNPYPFSSPVPTLLIGGEGTDIFFGGPGPDVMFGRGGIVDALHGGDGDDILIGGDGPDGINGGNGNDLIFGGDGDDILDGMAGDDTIFGGRGDDTLYAESPNDRIFGGDGDDLARYGAPTYQRIEDPLTGQVTYVYPPPLFEVPTDVERVDAYLDLDNPWIHN